MVSTDSDVRTGCFAHASLDPPASVLVLGPQMEPAVDGACASLLSDADPLRGNVLLVTLLESPDRRLDALRRWAGQLPGRVAVVSVGDSMRSAGAAGASNWPGSAAGAGADHGTGSASRGNIRTTSVSDPGDLTGIGVKIEQVLSAWTDEDAPTRTCFHSLTCLLQYADLDRVFKFLHVLTSRIEASNGLAHFHMDPTAVDDRTLATVRSLFDVVSEYEDGGWTTDRIGR